MKISEAKKAIEKALDRQGPYSHNICGCVLRAVSESHGISRANALIEEYALDEIYGINKVKEEKQNETA